MKNKKIQLLILLALVVITVLIYVNYRRNTSKLDSETIGIVNGTQIKLKDFEERLSNLKMNSVSDRGANVPSLKDTVLRRMIIEILLSQDARNNNIKISDDELNRYINNIKKSYTPEEFNQLLLNQFKTYEDWVLEVKNGLLIERTLSKETVEKINVSEKEVRDYYDKNYGEKMNGPKIRLAQIYTHTKEQAEKALAELKGGTVFADVAKKYSESPEAERGGVVGVIVKGEGVEVFDKAFNMRPSEISGIIQSDYGFHIFNVLEYIQPAKITYEEAKPFITAEIAREKEAKYYEEWLTKKMKKVKILINTALIDSVK